METNTNEILTAEQIKDLPKGALARKYKCTPQYVRQVLNGTRGKSRSYVADKIREDAQKILTILEN